MNSSYQHLTRLEQESIMIMHAQGKKQSEIANTLRRSGSTMSGEFIGQFIEVGRISANEKQAVNCVIKAKPNRPNINHLEKRGKMTISHPLEQRPISAQHRSRFSHALRPEKPFRVGKEISMRDRGKEFAKPP